MTKKTDTLILRSLPCSIRAMELERRLLLEVYLPEEEKEKINKELSIVKVQIEKAKRSFVKWEIERTTGEL